MDNSLGLLNYCDLVEGLLTITSLETDCVIIIKATFLETALSPGLMNKHFLRRRNNMGTQIPRHYRLAPGGGGLENAMIDRSIALLADAMAWLQSRWVQALMGVATEEPQIEVECRFDLSAPPGWAKLAMVVRNRAPYKVYLADLQIRWPRDGVLFTRREAFDQVGIAPHRVPFSASRVRARRIASLGQTLMPAGTLVSTLDMETALRLGITDTYAQEFYISRVRAVPGEAFRINMALRCESRTLDVRRQSIHIFESLELRCCNQCDTHQLGHPSTV